MGVVRGTRYELACTDCSFRATVAGDYGSVLEEIQAHQREREADPDAHFVNVRRRR